MSFLVENDDPFVVEEALAFIESCGVENEMTDSNVSSSERQGSASRNGGQANDYPRVHESTQSKAKKLRIKTFASSSTRQLQRKKAEMASLHEQVLDLQAHLNALKRAKYATLTSPLGMANNDQNASSGAANSVWYDQAVNEFVLRQQSESANKRLRTILANQRHVVESLLATGNEKNAIGEVVLPQRSSSSIYAYNFI